MLDVHLPEVARVLERHSSVGLFLPNASLLHDDQGGDGERNRQYSRNDSTNHARIRRLRSRCDVIVPEGEPQRFRQDRRPKVVSGLDDQLVHDVRLERFEFDAGFLGVKSARAEAADHVGQIVGDRFQVVPEHPVAFDCVRVLGRGVPPRGREGRFNDGGFVFWKSKKNRSLSYSLDHNFLIAQHLHVQILRWSRQSLAVLLEATDDRPRVLQGANPGRRNRLSTTPVQTPPWNILRSATAPMVGSVGGTLHQLVKVHQALGPIDDRLDVDVERTGTHAGGRHVLGHATLGDVAGGRRVPDAHRYGSGRRSEGVLGMTEVVSHLLGGKLVDRQGHRVQRGVLEENESVSWYDRRVMTSKTLTSTSFLMDMSKLPP